MSNYSENNLATMGYVKPEILAKADAKKINIIVEHDNEADNPREYDNLGTVAIMSSCGDITIDRKLPEYTGNLMNDVVNKICVEQNLNKNDLIFLPVYKFEHSGVTFSTKPFDDFWDSGLDGIIYVTKQQVRNFYQVGRISRKLLNNVTSALESEIKILATWAEGDTYSIAIRDQDGEIIDSCSSIYSTVDLNEILDDMIESYDYEPVAEVAG